MGKQVTIITVIFCMLHCISALSSPASAGSAFADSYLAFAPLYALYKSYASYLFSGTRLAIPPHLEQCCPNLLDSLEKLQVEIITQTDSQRIEQLTSLAHLRQRTVTFCQSYSGTIYDLASVSTADASVFKQAAQAGFFSAISHKNNKLEGIFSSTLETYSKRSQWEFAVAFSTKTILKQEELSRLDVSLSAILIGSKDNPYSPGIVPEDLLPQIRELATLARGDIDSADSEKVFNLARQIYNWLMQNS